MRRHTGWLPAAQLQRRNRQGEWDGVEVAWHEAQTVGSTCQTPIQTSSAKQVGRALRSAAGTTTWRGGGRSLAGRQYHRGLDT